MSPTDLSGFRTQAGSSRFSPGSRFRPARRLNGRVALAGGLALLSVLALLVGLSFVVPDTQTVLQATRDLPAGTVVQPDDIAPVKVRLPDTMAQTPTRERQSTKSSAAGVACGSQPVSC